MEFITGEQGTLFQSFLDKKFKFSLEKVKTTLSKKVNAGSLRSNVGYDVPTRVGSGTSYYVFLENGDIDKVHIEEKARSTFDIPTYELCSKVDFRYSELSDLNIDDISEKILSGIDLPEQEAKLYNAIKTCSANRGWKLVSRYGIQVVPFVVDSGSSESGDFTVGAIAFECIGVGAFEIGAFEPETGMGYQKV